ncbi:MAG: glycosyltransferase family 39 protein [Patescibacteria group bacterium]|nr:glycosyltransferase family 39 protein [Patescibacteria group bacterium]
MKKSLFFVFVISLLSTFLFLFKITRVPPALNADEATNAYDAYSILLTGQDQHGHFLPLRFQSFGDYKLPVITYLLIPWVAVFGLTEWAVRLVNLPFVFFFPILVYLLTKELFRSTPIAMIASFLTGFSPGLQTLGRQAHEGYLTAFFLTLSFYLILKGMKRISFGYVIVFGLSYFLFLFGYHSSRIWVLMIIGLLVYLTLKKKISFYYLLISLIITLFFIYTDLRYQPTRVVNLMFFKTPGFASKLTELRNETPFQVLHNLFTLAFRELTSNYLIYFSPQFLVIEGDKNPRFGFEGVSPITPVEYLFIFIGLYFLFANREKWRWLILILILLAPFSGSLSWAKQSLTRTVFLLIPFFIVASYGFFNFIKKTNLLLGLFFVLFYILFLFFSWEFYFFHYPKRAVVLRSWQVGYRELADYIKTNYHKFDRFYLTRKNGQPYIFLLFFLRYPPQRFQQQARLLPPDEYGFTQVREFDKFYFELWPIKETKNYVIIGYPDDFNLHEEKKLKEIKIGTETIFLIKEVRD